MDLFLTLINTLAIGSDPCDARAKSLVSLNSKQLGLISIYIFFYKYRLIFRDRDNNITKCT